MNVIRAESTGMCFGVRDALEVIESVDRPADVTIHGQLVHNETVLLQLGARGFQMTGETERDGLPATPDVLITAHGVSERERTRLERAGKRLIDTTCPLVTRVHRAAQTLQRRGYFVLVVGRRNHVEVRGIVEDLHDYAIVETEAEVRTYRQSRLGIVCQTTTAPATVAAVRQAVIDRNPHAEVRFLDTTCSPTRDNQRALEEMLPRVDAVVVVGGRNSNNTRELVANCRTAGKRVYHVQSADELKLEWFTRRDRVGIAAGTSTLDATVDAVEARLRAKL
jgi:4-hydroxy-3-methylbut-2-enyl diphosphate reductase